MCTTYLQHWTQNDPIAQFPVLIAFWVSLTGYIHLASLSKFSTLHWVLNVVLQSVHNAVNVPVHAWLHIEITPMAPWCACSNYTWHTFAGWYFSPVHSDIAHQLSTVCQPRSSQDESLIHTPAMKYPIAYTILPFILWHTVQIRSYHVPVWEKGEVHN